MYRKLMYSTLALTLVLAACGGSDPADTTGVGTETTAAAPDTTAPAETTAAGETTAAPAETTAAATETTVNAACSTDSDLLFEPGKLTIATGEPVFPPWMMDDDPTNGEGFESAVAYALAEELGFAAEDVSWVRTGFDQAIAPGEKDYDFNMQQYSITEERDEVVDFSIPYYNVQKSVIALSDTPAAQATTFAELAEANLGATIGTTDLDYIEQVIGDTDTAVYNTQADTVAALNAGQIDATVVGLPTAHFLTAVELENAVISGLLPEQGDSGEGMGLLFTEGNEYVNCVNPALEALHESGAIDAMAEEWLEQGGDIPLIEG
ncbi:MAG: transporter substrate-binding domain-containing protein [Acidimicrobiia bacterium]|nr:transporter substrate-binding domain-containing protein [Acidimicrobiia bacterium]